MSYWLYRGWHRSVWDTQRRTVFFKSYFGFGRPPFSRGYTASYSVYCLYNLPTPVLFVGVTKSPIVVNIWFVNEQNCVNLPIPLFRDDIILLFYRPDSIPVFVVYDKELGLNTPTFLVDQKNPKAGHLKHSCIFIPIVSIFKFESVWTIYIFSFSSKPRLFALLWRVIFVGVNDFLTKNCH